MWLSGAQNCAVPAFAAVPGQRQRCRLLRQANAYRTDTWRVGPGSGRSVPASGGGTVMIEWLKQQWEESVGVFRGGADRTLIALWLALLSIGLVMITSASIAFASEQYGDPWFFAKRHGFYLVLGLLGALVVAAVPIKRWQQHAGWLMVATLVLMCVVLVPGIGREVNGARRWLNLGVISVQVSEVAKFAAVLFFASFSQISIFA
jgi:cell division protein FtsW (lipid II flippase)